MSARAEAVKWGHFDDLVKNIDNIEKNTDFIVQQSEAIDSDNHNEDPNHIAAREAAINGINELRNIIDELKSAQSTGSSGSNGSDNLRAKNPPQGQQNQQNQNNNNQQNGQQGNQGGQQNNQNGQQGDQNNQNGNQNGQNGQQDNQNGQGGQNQNQSSQSSGQGGDMSQSDRDLSGSGGQDNPNAGQGATQEENDRLNKAVNNTNKPTDSGRGSNKKTNDRQVHMKSDGTYDLEININGQKHTVNVQPDLKSETGHLTDNDVDKSKSKTLDTNAKIKQNIELAIKNGKLDASDGYGSGGDGIGRISRALDINFAEHTNSWRTRLIKYCKQTDVYLQTWSRMTTTSYATNIPMKGRKKRKSKPEFRDVKVCIDVSGSVSDAQISRYLSEVSSILQAFNTSMELIYWSTNIGDTGTIKTPADFRNVDFNLTTGGTDVSCVFEYLTGEIPDAKGKYEKTKPLQIGLIMIITDGYFDDNYGRFETLIRPNRVMWLIDGGNDEFNPLFGETYKLFY